MVGGNRGRRSNLSAKKTRGKSSKPTQAAMARSLTAPQKAEVKSIVARSDTNRYVAEQILNSRDGGYVNFNSTIDSAADWYRCLPVIAQGTRSDQRTANRLKPVSTKLHFEFRFSTTDVQSRDIYVVMYILNPKFQKEYPSASVNSVLTSKYAEYLKLGNDTVVPFMGTWVNSTLPVQTNDFSVIKKKIIHLDQSSGDPNGTGVIGEYSGSGLGKYSVSGSFHKTLTVNLKVPTLRYSKNNDTIPNNYAPVWACGYYYANGTAPDTGGGLLAVSCRSEMTFKST